LRDEIGRSYLLYLPKLYPLKNDEERTNFCICYLRKLIKVTKRKERENPYFYRGVGVHKILERLTRTEILKLLDVEGTIKETIRK